MKCFMLKNTAVKYMLTLNFVHAGTLDRKAIDSGYENWTE